MNAKRLGLVLAGAAVAVAACTTTTTGIATAPDDVTPFTSTSKKPTRTPTGTRTPTATAAPPGAPGLPPGAFAEVRAAGIEGSDSAISDQVTLACMMAGSRFNDSKQDVVDVLIQMGSELPPEALTVIVDVAVKYECPEYTGKLGG